MGKARLAPIHEITIPRLELTAAVISAKLSEIIREKGDQNNDNHTRQADNKVMSSGSFKFTLVAV